MAVISPIGDGLSNNPAIWPGGVLPTLADQVEILTYQVQLIGRNAWGRTVVASGGALVATGVGNSFIGLETTDLYVTDDGIVDLDFQSGGQLIGMFNNRPHHANDTAGNSPDGNPHFWNALYCDGNDCMFRIRTPERKRMIRMDLELTATGTYMHLEEEATGWNIGDKVLVVDSRQLGPGTWTEEGISTFSRKREIFIVKGFSSDRKTVYLAHSAQYTHPGMRDLDTNELIHLPHAVNLYGKAVLLSSDPTDITTRFHVLFAGRRMHLDIYGTVIHGSGRTTIDEINNTVGAGFNPDFRLPCQVKGLYGPVDPIGYTGVSPYLPRGAQWRIEQCNIQEPWPAVTAPQTKAGLKLDQTAYGMAKGNAIFMWQGTNLHTTETVWRCLIEKNFCNFVTGNRDRLDNTPRGRTGVNLLKESTTNYYVDNVLTEAGIGNRDEQTYQEGLYCAHGDPNATQNVPAQQGDDPATDYITITTMAQTKVHPDDWDEDEAATGVYKFVNTGREAYGVSPRPDAPWFDTASFSQLSGSVGAGVVCNQKEYGHHNYSFYYPTWKLISRGMRAYCNPISQSSCIYYGDYFEKEYIIEDFIIRGFAGGISFSPNTTGSPSAGSQTVRNGTFQCDYGCLAGYRTSSGGGSQYVNIRTMTVEDVDFMDGGWVGYDQPANYILESGVRANILIPDYFYLNNPNSTGINYRIYTAAQDPDYVVAKTQPESGWADVGGILLVASPITGATNYELHRDFEPYDGQYWTLRHTQSSGGDSTHAKGPADWSYADGFWERCWIEFQSGENGSITAYDSTTKIMTLDFSVSGGTDGKAFMIMGRQKATADPDTPGLCTGGSLWPDDVDTLPDVLGYVGVEP